MEEVQLKNEAVKGSVDQNTSEQVTSSLDSNDDSGAATAQQTPAKQITQPVAEPPSNSSDEASSVSGADNSNKDETESSGVDWQRYALAILVSVFLYFEVTWGVMLLVAVSIGSKLLLKKIPTGIANFTFAYQQMVTGTLRYVLFVSNEKPWPLAPWPKSSPGDEV